jgi:hypothetical protein
VGAAVLVGVAPVACQQFLGLSYQICADDCDAAGPDTGQGDRDSGVDGRLADAVADGNSSDGLTPVTPIYRINCGGPDVDDFSGDYLGCHYCGGDASDPTDPFERDAEIDMTLVDAKAVPAKVFQSFRYDDRAEAPDAEGLGRHFSYVFPGLTTGRVYQVRLHFADIFDDAAGQREFNVQINDKLVLAAFDIIGTAGAPDKAIDESFFSPAVDGQLVVDFTSTAAGDVACVNGIEIWATE